jgi:hypothetical protein
MAPKGGEHGAGRDPIPEPRDDVAHDTLEGSGHREVAELHTLGLHPRRLRSNVGLGGQEIATLLVIFGLADDALFQKSLGTFVLGAGVDESGLGRTTLLLNRPDLGALLAWIDLHDRLARRDRFARRDEDLGDATFHLRQEVDRATRFDAPHVLAGIVDGRRLHLDELDGHRSVGPTRRGAARGTPGEREHRERRQPARAIVHQGYELA